MNLSYQASYLQDSMQYVHVDNGYLCKICKSNSIFSFLKKGPQNVMSQASQILALMKTVRVLSWRGPLKLAPSETWSFGRLCGNNGNWECP